VRHHDFISAFAEFNCDFRVSAGLDNIGGCGRLAAAAAVSGGGGGDAARHYDLIFILLIPFPFLVPRTARQWRM